MSNKPFPERVLWAWYDLRKSKSRDKAMPITTTTTKKLEVG